jgi:hypothetical protein
MEYRTELSRSENQVNISKNLFACHVYPLPLTQVITDVLALLMHFLAIKLTYPIATSL